MAKRGILGKVTLTSVLLTAVVLGLAAFGGFYFKKYNDLKNASPEKLQQAQLDETLAAVGKLYTLPKDEKPEVATVNDKEEVKKQYPILDQVENGDILIVYRNAKTAILYRPSTEKIIKVVPVNVQAQLSVRTVGSDAERAAVEKLLTDAKVAFTAGGVSKTTLSGIIVVDLKGTNGESAKQLAQTVKGTVGSLPAGEDKPNDVDLLILVGPTTTPTQ